MDKAVVKQWTMGNGQWAIANGKWAKGNAQWATGKVDKSQRQDCPKKRGSKAGQWCNNGQKAMRNGQWARR